MALCRAAVSVLMSLSSELPFQLRNSTIVGDQTRTLESAFLRCLLVLGDPLDELAAPRSALFGRQEPLQHPSAPEPRGESPAALGR